MILATPLTVSNSCSGTLRNYTDTANLIAGDGGLKLINGYVPANGSCTVTVAVTAPTATTKTYYNDSDNLYVGNADTTDDAIFNLQATSGFYTPPSPPAVCNSPTTLATWTMPALTTEQGYGGPPPPYTTLNTPSVTSATSSFTNGGSGTNSISTTQGRAANSWSATGWAGTPGTIFPSATIAPYYEFVIDTTNYGGARIGFDYAKLANGDWQGPGDNRIYVYSKPDNGSFSSVSTTNSAKGSWQTALNGMVQANAAATGTSTTTFRVNATGAGKPAATLYLDNISFRGCIRPEPPRVTTKSFSPNPITAGGTSTMTITINNPNTDTHVNYNFTNLTLGDSFPSGMTIANATPTYTPAACGTGATLRNYADTANLVAGDSGFTLKNVSLNANTSCTIALQVTVPSSTTPEIYTNTTDNVKATVGGNVATNYTTSGKATASLYSVVPPTIEKNFAPNPILTGGKSKLTFILTNPNPNPATPNLQLTGVSFTDVFPKTPTYPGDMVVATPLNTNNTCGGTLRNNADTADLTAGHPGIKLINGTIPANGSCTVWVEVIAPNAGDYLNTSGSPSHTLNGTWTSADTATDTLTAKIPNPSFKLIKQVGTSSSGPWSSFVSVNNGNNVWFRLSVENTGDIGLNTISVTDTDYAAQIAGCTWYHDVYDGNFATADLPVLSPITPPLTLPVAAREVDPSATCVFGPVSASPAGLYENTATASAKYGSGPAVDVPNDAINHTDTARFATVGLTLAKNANKTFFSPPVGDPLTSDIITYSFVVTNSGYAPLLAPVTITDAMTDGATCPLTTTVGDNDNYLDPAEFLTCTKAYTVTAGDLSAKTITNTATASAGGVTSNTATKTIPLGADLSAVKVNNVGGTAPEASFIWTITVSNSASSGAATFDDTQILLQDDLPSSGATYTVGTVTKTSAISGPILCTITDNTLTCKANGGTVTVPGGLQGTVTVTQDSNVVTGIGTNFDPQISVSDTIILDGTLYTVATRTSDTNLTLTSNFTGTTQSDLTIPASLSVPVTVNIATIGSLVNPRNGGICRTDPGTVIGETNESNNDCAANTVIIGMPMVSILKSADKTATGAAPGEIVTYTIQLNNTGNGVGKTVVLRDDMSPYTTLKLDYDDTAAPVEPFFFSDTTTPPDTSGLSINMVEYSTDGTTWIDWSVTPPTDGGGGAPAGYDATITHWRLTLTSPTDKFKTGGSIQLMYKTMVK